MREQDLLYWLRATPFVPFRIRLNSGREFVIRHPEMVKVGKTTAIIFTYLDGSTDRIEQFDMVSLVLMETIQPLETARSA